MRNDEDHVSNSRAEQLADISHLQVAEAHLLAEVRVMSFNVRNNGENAFRGVRTVTSGSRAWSRRSEV
eukprot:2180756-Pyramimonas_sp.AAC.1